MFKSDRLEELLEIELLRRQSKEKPDTPEAEVLDMLADVKTDMYIAKRYLDYFLTIFGAFTGIGNKKS